jgi:hypothetical protein
MIVGGIGMLMLQGWGRVLTLLWAVVRLLLSAAVLAVYLVAVLPMLDDIIASLGAPEEARGILRMTMMVALGLSVASAVYAVIVLVLMTRPHVKAAFAGQEWAPPRPPGSGPEDYYDRPEDRSPYRPGDPGIQP